MTKKCPFKKQITYNSENWQCGVAIRSAVEDFEECIGETCMAFLNDRCVLCNYHIPSIDPTDAFYELLGYKSKE